VPDTIFAKASRLVAREGWLIDQKRWDDWLDLYLPDAEYWLPCFLEDGSVTSDPQRQISLIYYSSRAGLEDRVFRIRTGQSLASTPLPRTAHTVSVGDVVRRDDGDIEVGSSWAAFSYKLEAQYHFFGTQRHVLKPTDSGLRIASRHILVMNDKIPCPLDIYSV
jgi:3-phenylpropionate/cinnamic acid dioxygenase small subunit